MNITYDKAAILSYISSMENLELSFRRTMDESLSNHQRCVQAYSRIRSSLEEGSHIANSRLLSAESMLRSAEAECETAKRILENSEDESQRSAARNRMERAHCMKMESNADIAQATASVAAYQTKLDKLTKLWEQYSHQCQRLKRQIEDSFSGFITVSEQGNKDLATFIRLMEKALVALNAGPATAASATAQNNGSSADHIATNNIGSPAQDRSTSSCGTVTQKGNSFGVICSGGQEHYIMNVGGSVQCFPCTESGLSSACQFAGASGDQEMIAQTEAFYQSRMATINSAKDDRWNKEFMPLVHANIRRSVELYFSDYVPREKLEKCLQTISFMDQAELARRAREDLPDGTLGFNNGSESNIAHDVEVPSQDGWVGDTYIQGSGGANINYAFVTAVHENLHMMSANDTSFEHRRGLMIGRDETSRAMNEAFTEYFTFLSCGGESAFGGVYPGVYSSYHPLMQEMPIIEKAVGRDCMMEAYFHNRPQRMREAIDAILGAGAWDDMCRAAYDALYNNNINNGNARLHGYLNRLKGLSG